MVEISIVLPQRDAGEAVAWQLPALCTLLARNAASYEIICVDDGSAAPTLCVLEEMAREHPSLRIVRLDSPSGLSLALSAGMAVARGKIIVAIEASDRFPVAQIPDLIAQLTRADLVFGQRRRTGWAKQWQRIARLPRWLLLGLEVRDPECLLWAARREALAGMQLTRGMYRYFPSLVASRGFRVIEAYVESRPSDLRCPILGDGRPNPGDLLVAWWLVRQARHEVATERAGHETLIAAQQVRRDDPHPAQNAPTQSHNPAASSARRRSA